MDDTYFIEIETRATNSNCTSMQFHANKPFSSVEDAKERVTKNPDPLAIDGMARIYKCHNNRLLLILLKAAHSKDWQPFEYIRPQSGDLTAET